jgi:foldase protein PrsA
MSRGRRAWAAATTLTVVLGAGLAGPALAQQGARKGTAAKNAPKPNPAPVLVVKKHLVNPSDPIALVNGEAITRQELADECVALKGEEVLEAMIGRKLIAQAIRAKKIEVTPEEVDAEIERVAQSVAGVSREKWLATLDKERNISPARYAREIIQPSLALKKLAGPLVTVTDQDIKDAFEAQFGERLKCRMILLNSLPIAKQVWEDLKANPNLFEKLAQDKSVDPDTRSLGGLLREPVPRHGYPREVFDKVFAQLVDVDPSVKPGTPEYEKLRPKDGDISGIIQVSEGMWAIFKREGLIPAQPYDPNNQELVKQMKASIHEAKIQEKIGELYQEMMRQARIENMLTGKIKDPGDEEPKAMVDRVGTPDEAVNRTAAPAPDSGTAPSAAPAGAKPAALAPADAAKVESLKPKK